MPPQYAALAKRGSRKKALGFSFTAGNTTTTAAATSSQLGRSGRGSSSGAQRPDYPPFVVLVDIDGTIIGDIDAQLIEYQLVVTSSAPATLGSAAATTNSRVKFKERMFRDRLVMQLMNGLMRPGFSAFCAQCAVLNIPVMLYTAAENQWAAFLAPALLQAVRLEMERDLENPPLHFRFVKLFSRKDCLLDSRSAFSYSKSIQKILPGIYNALKRYYTMSKGPQPLLHRTILIDNTHGVLKEDKQQVSVPTYNFALLYDVTSNLDYRDARRLNRAKAMLRSPDSSFLDARLRSTVPNAPGADPLRAWLYHALALKLKKDPQTQEHQRQNDNLWKTLRKRMFQYMQMKYPYNGENFARYLMGHGL